MQWVHGSAAPKSAEDTDSAVWRLLVCVRHAELASTMLTYSAVLPVQDGYGLGVQGFEVPELGPGIFWGHAGVDPGYSSFACYGREANTTFALFLNNENLEPIRNLMLDGVAEVLNGTATA